MLLTLIFKVDRWQRSVWYQFVCRVSFGNAEFWIE